MLLHDITPVMEVEKSIRRFDNFVFARYLGAIPERSAKWGAALTAAALPLYFLLIRPLFGLIVSVNMVVEIIILIGFIGLIAFAGGKAAITRMAHGKEASALLSSWASYRLGPKRIVDFRPWRSQGTQRFDVELAVQGS